MVVLQWHILTNRQSDGHCSSTTEFSRFSEQKEGKRREKNATSVYFCPFWYQCYYPHRSRNSVSPICRIFHQGMSKLYKKQLIFTMKNYKFINKVESKTNNSKQTKNSSCSFYMTHAIWRCCNPFFIAFIFLCKKNLESVWNAFYINVEKNLKFFAKKKS